MNERGRMWWWDTRSTKLIWRIWADRRRWGKSCLRKHGDATGCMCVNTEILGDGAPWVWNQAEEHFGGSQQAVDWCHAAQHLHAACDRLHPPDTPAAQRWLNKHTELLYQGHADQIAQALHATAQSQPGADAEAGYFETNHRRMQYMQLREDGWVIGSGMVESGCKQNPT